MCQSWIPTIITANSAIAVNLFEFMPKFQPNIRGICRISRISLLARTCGMNCERKIWLEEEYAVGARSNRLSGCAIREKQYTMALAFFSPCFHPAAERQILHPSATLFHSAHQPFFAWDFAGDECACVEIHRVVMVYEKIIIWRVSCKHTHRTAPASSKRALPLVRSGPFKMCVCVGGRADISK